MSNNLPSEYQRVEYIDVPAAAFIILDFKMSSKYSIKTKVSCSGNTSTEQYIFGEYPGMLAHLGFRNNAQGNDIFLGDTHGWLITSTKYQNNNAMVIETIIYPKVICKVDNIEIYTPDRKPIMLYYSHIDIMVIH